MWWCPRAHSTGPPLDSVNLRTYSSARPRVRLLFRVSVVWSPNVIFIREPVNSDENHSVLLHNQISQTEIFKIYLGEIMEQQKISENTAGGRISWPFGKITYVVMWNLGILYRTSILPSGTDFEKLWHTGHRQDVPEHLQRRRSSQWARCPEEGNRRARSYLHNTAPQWKKYATAACCCMDERHELSVDQKAILRTQFTQDSETRKTKQSIA